jgi:hypothetical protein
MNQSNNTNKKVLLEFKTPYVFYPFVVLILFLIIIMFIVLYYVKNPDVSSVKSPTSDIPLKSQEQIVASIFAVLSFSLLVFLISVIFLPNFKDLKLFFQEISSVTYFLVFTIFLILFFTLLPTDILNNYASIIIPITTLLGSFLFYKSLSSNYILDYNVNYERIKTLILFFCLITTFITYYNVDPGGFIQKYFGYSLLLTIIIAVFSFLYLLIILTLPDSNSSNYNPTNLLENFTRFSTYGSALFLIFIIVMTVIISTYPGGFFTDKTRSAGVLILLLLICILWSTLLGANLFSDVIDNVSIYNKTNLFKRSLLILFGLVISSLIIYWIVYNVQSLSGTSSIVSLVLNLLLVLIVLGLIYKTINTQFPPGTNSKKNGFFNLILQIIFYIPCIFSGLFDNTAKFFTGKSSAETYGSLLMLILAIIIILLYFSVPSLFNKLNLQGGKQLVNQPVYTDTIYSLGTYQDLNGGDKFDYHFAISCWIFLDAAPPNTNASYEKYTSLLNFGNKPNILYNGSNNTLMVTMQQKDLQDKTNNKLTDFDENGNRIIYKNKKILLQKWNNIIINYNGGVLDIFLNGELVKSNIGVVPYYTIDNLTIGEKNGIKGGICNVVYFRHSLNASNIYLIYNLVKNKTPPITNDSNETILNKNLTTLNSSIKTVS